MGPPPHLPPPIPSTINPPPGAQAGAVFPSPGPCKPPTLGADPPLSLEMGIGAHANRENRARTPHKPLNPTSWSLLLSCLTDMAAPTVLGGEHQPRRRDRPLGKTFEPITPLTTNQVTASPSGAAAGLYLSDELGHTQAHARTRHRLVLPCNWTTAPRPGAEGCGGWLLGGRASGTAAGEGATRTMWGPQAAPVTGPCQRAEVTRQVKGDPAHPSVPGPQHQAELTQKGSVSRLTWVREVALEELRWPPGGRAGGGRLSRLPPA